MPVQHLPVWIVVPAVSLPLSLTGGKLRPPHVIVSCAYTWRWGLSKLDDDGEYVMISLNAEKLTLLNSLNCLVCGGGSALNQNVFQC